MWSFQRFQLNLNSAKKNCKKNSFSKGFPGAIHIKTCQRNPKDLWHTFLKARRTTRKCFLSSCQDICGVIFNPKIYFADFGNFKEVFFRKFIRFGTATLPLVEKRTKMKIFICSDLKDINLQHANLICYAWINIPLVYTQVDIHLASNIQFEKKLLAKYFGL